MEFSSFVSYFIVKRRACQFCCKMKVFCRAIANTASKTACCPVSLNVCKKQCNAIDIRIPPPVSSSFQEKVETKRAL